MLKKCDYVILIQFNRNQYYIIIQNIGNVRVRDDKRAQQVLSSFSITASITCSP